MADPSFEPSILHPPIDAPLGDVSTTGLSLRRPRLEDLDALAVVFAEPAVWHYPYGRGHDRAETEAFVVHEIEAWSDRGFGLWLASEKRSGTLVGYVGLSVPTFLPEILPAVEVGWRFAPMVWGRGYATEGGAMALREAFTTLGLPDVWCIVEPDNLASLRVAERLGLLPDHTTVAPATPQRGPRSISVLRMNRRDWEEGSARGQSAAGRTRGSIRSSSTPEPSRRTE